MNNQPQTSAAQPGTCAEKAQLVADFIQRGYDAEHAESVAIRIMERLEDERERLMQESSVMDAQPRETATKPSGADHAASRILSSYPTPSRPATARLIEVILADCDSKHQLHPMELDVNGDYNVEVTFAVQELRQFLVENSDAWEALAYIHANMP